MSADLQTSKPPAASSTRITIPIVNLSRLPQLFLLPRLSGFTGLRERLWLREIYNIESSKWHKEDARNNLESYLYKLGDLLGDESQTPFRKCSQPAERSAVRKKLEETLTWIHDEVDNADTNQFLEKLSGLEYVSYVFSFFLHCSFILQLTCSGISSIQLLETKEFPKALNNSQTWNWSSWLFITEARQNLTAEAEGGPSSRYTHAEIDFLEKMLRGHEAWLAEWAAKQPQVPMSQNPIILTSEMKARAKVPENHLQKLWKKVPPTKRPVDRRDRRRELRLGRERLTPHAQ